MFGGFSVCLSRKHDYTVIHKAPIHSVYNGQYIKVL